VYIDLKCKLPHVYAEMGRLCMKGSSLHFLNDSADVILPVGRISVIFMGPGSTITHSAVKHCCWADCSIMWVGEGISKCYTVSACKSRSSENLQRQIYVHAHEKRSLLKRYYRKRFGGLPLLGLVTEERIRGSEGSKMKKAYIECAKKYGVPWSGRMVEDAWNDQTVCNRAISICNSYLYVICSAVLSVLGYSTALGILHNGNMLSFSFDMADLYKIDFSIPLGFETAAKFKFIPWDSLIEKDLRRRALNKLCEMKLLTKILRDTEDLFGSVILPHQEHEVPDEKNIVGLSV